MTKIVPLLMAIALSIGVGGRYLVVAKDAADYEGLLRVADRVIEMARKTAVR